jgi:Na+/proline symporter
MTMLRTPRELPKLSLYAVITNMITGLMVMAIGYCAIYLVAAGKVVISHPDTAVFKVADYLGILAQLFVYPAVLAAALSTSSLFLSLAGTIVSRDLSGALGIHLQPARQVSVSRIAMMLMGFAAIGFAALSGDMVAILGTYGFGTLATATFPIFVIGLLWRKATSRGVMLGMLTGLVTTLGGIGVELLKRFGLSEFAWPGGVPWYVFVMAAAVIVTIAASLLDQAGSEDQLDHRVQMALEL